jgi:hypothetical protein
MIDDSRPGAAMHCIWKAQYVQMISQPRSGEKARVSWRNNKYLDAISCVVRQVRLA